MSFSPIQLISLVVLVACFAGAALELKKINKKELYFQENRDMSFSCVASNVGVNDSIQWSTRESLGSNEDIVSNVTGESVIVDTRNGSTLTSTISLKNSTKYKEARYFLYCKLLDDGGGELEKKTFQFRPIRRKNWPNVTVSPKEIKVGYGENFTLNCRTRGNLRAAGTELHVTWSKAGNVLKSDSQTALRNVVNLNYTVQKADGSSGGNYICKAFPKVAIQIEVSETVIVSVLPKLFGEQSKKLYSEIGKQVTIPCNIDGYPLTIAWQRKTAGGTYQDVKGNTRVSIQDNGKNLTIRSFQSDDAAEYVCKVKENQNIVQKTELIERVFAHIENGSKSQENVTLIPGKTSKFECGIVAVPSCVSWNAYSLHNGTKRDATSVSGVVKPSRCDNTLLLKNISAIRSGQIFSCTNGDVTQKFLVVKMTKPLLTGKPTKEVKSEEGDDVTLKCDIEVTPLKIEWSDGDRPITGSKYVISPDPRVLHVKNVDYDDRGSFFCSAKNELDKKGVKQRIILRIKVFPKLVGEQSKKLYSEIGKQVTIQCNIDGYPLTIAWQRKTAGGTYQDIKGNTRFSIQDNGKNLTIRSFQSDDAAEYVCKVKENQNIFQKTELIERVFAHIENGSKSQENVTLIPGKTSKFECGIVAVPSCVSWNAYSLHDGTKRDATSVSGVVKPSRCDNTLLLKNISAIENGQIFSCTNGNVTQKFLVVKMTKPLLTGKPTKEVKSEEGDDVTLKCDIEVTPLKIEWSDGDRPITGSKYVISTDPRVLHVKNVEYDDRGSFFCSAKNELDKKGVKQRIILRIKSNINDSPSPLLPVVGTIVAILVVVIIATAIYIKRRKNERRRIEEKELEECPGGAHTDGTVNMGLDY